MGWWKPAICGAGAGALTGVAAMIAWYFMFPPGAPEQYFVAISGTDDRYATLAVDPGTVVKIVVFFSLLGAVIAVGLATLRRQVPSARLRIFDATSVVGLCTLSGAALTAVVYGVDHQFESSNSPGHWPSAHYDHLAPLMPVLGCLIGLIGAATWLRFHSTDQ